MQELHFQNRELWRSWLAENHDTVEEGIWLVYYKKETGTPSMDYEASVEEALCYGWIDSIIKKLDAERYVRKFTPRKLDSLWSDSNKKRVRKLIDSSQMTAAGLAKIAAAKASGLWEQPPVSGVAFELPEEFTQALAAHSKARSFFDSLAPSYRKYFIGWIASAKRPETRERRIQESIALLEKGEKLGMK